MTDIVIPPTIDALPPAPLPSDSPSEFDAKAFALLAAQQTLVGQMNGSASATMTNADLAESSASAASAAAVAAVAAQDIALAGAAFKGLWPALAGPLSKPASVKHNNRFWLLLNDLANVAASQPGVSADWTPLTALQVTQTITSSTTAVAGVYYVASVAGVTLTIPNTFQQGDFVGGRNTSAGVCYINWTTNTLINQTPESPMRWPSGGKFDARFDGSTFA